MGQKEEQNLATTRKIYEAMFVGDTEKLKTYLDPDITVYEAESLPYGGSYRGLSGVERLSRLVFETWEDMDFKLEEVTAGGDRTVALMHFSGKGRKTGRTFSFPIAEAWRFKDGKAIEWRPFYYDTKKACEVYGD